MRPGRRRGRRQPRARSGHGVGDVSGRRRMPGRVSQKHRCGMPYSPKSSTAPNTSERSRQKRGFFASRYRAADSPCTLSGIVLMNERVAVSEVPRWAILEQLHSCRLSVRGMNTLARLHFYWPAIASDIERAIRSDHQVPVEGSETLRNPLPPLAKHREGLVPVTHRFRRT